MSIKRIGRNRFKIDVHIYQWPERPQIIFDGTREEAKAKARDLKLQLEYKKQKQLGLATQKFRTFGECLEYWIGTTKKNGKPRRERAYRSYYERLMKYLGHMPIEEIWFALEKFVPILSDMMGKRSDFGPEASVNRHIAVAKAAVRAAYKKHIPETGKRAIPENYLEDYETLTEHNIRFRILDPYERRRLWNTLPEFLKPRIYFHWRVPARKEEVRLLTKKHLDLFNRMIFLGWHETKSGSGRWLPIYPEMVPYFESLMQIDCEYLFYREVGPGRFVQQGDHDFAYESACRRAGIEGYNFHKTRQQAAMEMLKDGHSRAVVKAVGGWNDDQTFDRYVHVPMQAIMRELGLKVADDPMWKIDMAPGRILAA